MTQILWSQDTFTKGELSPLMYSRVTLQTYYQGLKRAKNVICFPQGTAGKRFGTLFQYQLDPSLNNYQQIYFKSFQYLNECCYIVFFYGDHVTILLEGQVQATVAGTGIAADEVQLIDHTILENRFRVAIGILAPKELVRKPGTPEAITAFGSNTFTTGTAHTVATFFPARFTAATMPTTSPQIHSNKTYFVRFITATTYRVYLTAQDAAADINSFVITSAGTTAFMTLQNNWSFPFVDFKQLPQFDFEGGYDAITFTPAAKTGFGVTITMSGILTAPATMDSKYIGGSYRGNQGIGRITAVTDTTHFVVDIIPETPFADTVAIPGSLSLLTENAWSDLRTWPRKCSSFQNRAFFANTDLLSNGLWGSVTNDFVDYDDLNDNDDDSAISWFPTSDQVNYIQFIVPYRSLTVHTNSGVYSTPLSVETAITPNNFSLSLQDSTPADSVQPQGIDNQIIVLSGNDAHSLLWDGFNNAYTSNIISVANEQLLRTPIDEASYTDRVRAGSRYMFIVNEIGTLAIYQSLIGENVSGFTEVVMEQPYGNAYFRAVCSNFDGRAWFLVERQIAGAGSTTALTTYTPVLPETGTEIFTAAAHGMTLGITTAVLFSTTGVLLTSTPQIQLLTYYWAVPIDANTFRVYLSQADAEAEENAILANLIPINNSVTPWPLTTVLMVEQLSFDAEMDCVGLYPTPLVSGSTNTIAGQSRFNAQNILMQGDGFGFDDDVVGGNVEFIAHGSPVNISEAQYGFPINVEITPLPISMSMTGNPKSSNLVDTKHLKWATFLFADTIGGTITQDNLTFPIALDRLNDIDPGVPPIPQTGAFLISVMGAWDDFNKPSFTINHSEPFGIKLTGIFYKVEA